MYGIEYGIGFYLLAAFILLVIFLVGYDSKVQLPRILARVAGVAAGLALLILAIALFLLW